MAEKNAARIWLAGYFLLASIEAGVGIVFQLVNPVAAGDPFLWGRSFSQTLVIAAFLLAFVATALLALRCWCDSAWTERTWQYIVSSPLRVFRLVLGFGAAFLLFTTILFTPLYRFGPWKLYVERLLPFVGWWALTSAQAFLGMAFWKTRAAKKRTVPFSKNVLLFSGIAFLTLMTILLWVAQTKIGIVTVHQTQWHPVGVPLLPGQVWIMIWLTVAFGGGWAFLLRSPFISEKLGEWKLDILIGWAIWIVAAVLWASTSLPRSFFFPGPYPPNHVIYPYADSAIWDRGGIYALIGQGFGNSNPFVDHIGLMGLLAFLHILVGDDYARISAALAGLLAIFPALMYWLGKAVHSRWAGFFIAGLTIFHELNAFAASNMIDLSHARFLLTEYPTRVGLAALALFLFLWFRAPRQNIAYALPVGGLLAFLILLRFNTLAFPLAVSLGALLIYGRDWKGWIRASLLVMISITIVLAPWMWRSWTLSGTPFFFVPKMQNIFNEEFRLKTSVAPASPASLLNFGTNLSSGRQLVRSETSTTPVLRDSPTSPRMPDAQKVSNSILEHFMHNWVASVLILPTSFAFDDVRHTIYEVHPYWEKKGSVWQGEMTPMEMMLLIVNLALLSIGLGVSWRKWKLVGLIPLGICLAYALSLAVVRTSGGRYIVNMDWGILFYWVIGLTQVILFLGAYFGMDVQGQGSSSTVRGFSYRHGWLSLLPFLLFVVAMTIMDRAVPARYPAMYKREILGLLKQTGVLEQMSISERELTIFLKKQDARAYWGRALYPRFYRIGQGEFSSGVDGYEPAQYPRLAFTLIGPFAPKGIVLPFIRPPARFQRDAYFPNASDVIVFGCQRPDQKQIIDALLVVVVGEQTTAYVRQPEAPLQCPLPEPVCESNLNCR